VIMYPTSQISTCASYPYLSDCTKKNRVQSMVLLSEASNIVSLGQVCRQMTKNNRPAMSCSETQHFLFGSFTKNLLWPVLHMKKSRNALTAEKWLYLSTRWCKRINQKSQGSNPLMGHLAILCQEYIPYPSNSQNNQTSKIDDKEEGTFVFPVWMIEDRLCTNSHTLRYITAEWNVALLRKFLSKTNDPGELPQSMS